MFTVHFKYIFSFFFLFPYFILFYLFIFCQLLGTIWDHDDFRKFFTRMEWNFYFLSIVALSCEYRLYNEYDTPYPRGRTHVAITSDIMSTAYFLVSLIFVFTSLTLDFSLQYFFYRKKMLYNFLNNNFNHPYSKITSEVEFFSFLFRYSILFLPC